MKLLYVGLGVGGFTVRCITYTFSGAVSDVELRGNLQTRKAVEAYMNQTVRHHSKARGPLLSVLEIGRDADPYKALRLFVHAFVSDKFPVNKFGPHVYEDCYVLDRLGLDTVAACKKGHNLILEKLLEKATAKLGRADTIMKWEAKWTS